MRVLVVGGGYYGCYAVRTLERLSAAAAGNQPIHIDWIDRNGLFSGSSSRNQNRLHLSFHYPMSDETRRECVAGFDRFRREFPESLSQAVPRNLYMVANHPDSRLTLDEYQRIYDDDGTPYRLVAKTSVPGIDPDRFDGASALEVDERYLDHDVVRRYFQSELATPCRVTSTADEADTLVKSGRYDVVLNCTYGAWTPVPLSVDVVYEWCCGWIYDHVGPVGDGPLNLIVMDGPFFSMFPHQGQTLLTHVRHTPLRRSSRFDDLLEDPVTDAEIEVVRGRVEDDVVTYIPGFRRDYRYSHHIVASKCKMVSAQGDDRSLYSHVGVILHDATADDANVGDGGGDGTSTMRATEIHTFIGGKITGIFAMEDRLRARFH